MSNEDKIKEAVKAAVIKLKINIQNASTKVLNKINE
jgi:hypothetical protein